MASRAMRPRGLPHVVPYALNGFGAVTGRGTVAQAAAAVQDVYLQQITAARTNQAQLETILKAMGAKLRECQIAVVARGKAGDSAGVAAAQACVNMVSKDIALCIADIKACAAAANAAAAAALKSGSTLTDVRKVSTSVAQPPPAVLPPPPSTTVHMGPTVTNEAGQTQDVVVETNTPALQPDGTILPGPDATVVTTPQVTDPSDPASGGVPSAGIGLVGIGLALGVAWLVFRK